MEDDTSRDPSAVPEGSSGDGEPGGSPAGPEGEGPKEPRRASVFPSIAPPPGPNYRVVLAFVWVAVQVVLISTASRRSDGAFGFRMFNESSTLEIALFREVSAPDGTRARVHVDGGVWTARGGDGSVHRLTWYDRVPSPYWIFDQPMHASYGAAAQLARLQGAADDVVSHLATSEDVETRRVLLDVTIRRNGREPVVHRLASRERDLPPIAPVESQGGP